MVFFFVVIDVVGCMVWFVCFVFSGCVYDFVWVGMMVVFEGVFV